MLFVIFCALISPHAFPSTGCVTESPIVMTIPMKYYRNIKYYLSTIDILGVLWNVENGV